MGRHQCRRRFRHRLVMGSVANHILNYFFTFKSDKCRGEAASKYFTLLGIGWCINTGLMWLLVHQLGWYYWLAQALATGIGLI
jgi:putative flippase GtrA